MIDDTTEPRTSAEPLLRVAHAIYALQAGAFLLGFTAIIAIVVNYIKADDARGTWLDSHFRWQRRTFWWGLVWGALGTATALVGVGFVILFADAVWLVYRIAKGWLNLLDRKPMYLPPPAASNAS